MRAGLSAGIQKELGIMIPTLILLLVSKRFDKSGASRYAEWINSQPKRFSVITVAPWKPYRLTDAERDVRTL